MTQLREQIKISREVRNLQMRAGTNSWIFQTGTSLANDATETTIVSKTVWGGTLSTNNAIIIQQVIKHLNNSGVNRTFSVRFYWGGSVVFNSVETVVASATDRLFVYDIWLAGNGATNAQIISARRTFSSNNFASAGNVVSDDFTASVDSTTDQTLSITWQHQVAAATITADERLTRAEFVGAVS